MAEETNVPPASRLDADDRAILAHLRVDGRASQRDVAAATGLSLATVNRRIRRLEGSGAIRGYAAVLDPEAVGWGLTTVIGLRIDKGHLRKVQESIARDPRVFAVYDVTGEWDGLVLARVRDRADLDDLAKGALSTPHIQRTNTMVVLSTVLDGSLTDVPGLPQPRHKKA
jgi:DNA-binding Lrp family transcriptional regulator